MKARWLVAKLPELQHQGPWGDLDGVLGAQDKGGLPIFFGEFIQAHPRSEVHRLIGLQGLWICPGGSLFTRLRPVYEHEMGLCLHEDELQHRAHAVLLVGILFK